MGAYRVVPIPYFHQIFLRISTFQAILRLFYPYHFFSNFQDEVPLHHFEENNVYSNKSCKYHWVLGEITFPIRMTFQNHTSNYQRFKILKWEMNFFLKL